MPQLRIIEGVSEDSRHILSSSLTIIGRADADIVISDSYISSRHAQIKELNENWIIEDIGSRNGTFVNDERITCAVQLKPNDKIQLGSTILLFEQHCTNSNPSKTLRKSQLRDGRPRIIGRSPDSDIQINEAVVSLHHARLTYENNKIVLTDLFSSNGTFVNGYKITQTVIKTGDSICIGSTEYTISEDAFLQVGIKEAIRLDIHQVSHSVLFRGEMRTLLDNVEFSVKPGEFVAVVGGSGTGKTSLFRIMTGMESPTTGKVLLNGIDFHTQSRQFAGQVGFVPQDDIVHSELTVKTALYYAAKLRLPPDTTDSECETRVMSVLKDVKLTHRIDSDIKLLSGGERKRVNVALELLTEPNLLFLDEPTSGLDPLREKQIMELMRQLAGEGRTILLTTHSTLNLDLCDLLLIMGAGGHVVYFGSPRQALSHFKVSAYHDIYAKLGDTPQDAIRRKNEYVKSPIFEKYGGIRNGRTHIATQPSIINTGTSFDPEGWVRQFILLSQRYLSILIKDHMNLGILLAQAPILVLILLLVFPGNSFDSVLNTDGSTPLKYAHPITFFIALIAIWFGTSNSIREIVKEVPITIRERLAFLRPTAYLCSKFVVLAGLCLFQCLVLIIGVGLRMSWFYIDGGAVWSLFWVTFLTSLAGLSFGLTLSSIARSSDQALSLIPLALVPQIVFSGIFLPENASGLVSVIAKIHMSYWSYSALGSIININSKMESIYGPAFTEIKCFSGNTNYKVIMLFFLFVIITCISMYVVNMKRKR
jgi:ABC-type multidrug transport system ATPase subunit